jgi:hypothetical protein
MSQTEVCGSRSVTDPKLSVVTDRRSRRIRYRSRVRRSPACAGRLTRQDSSNRICDYLVRYHYVISAGLSRYPVFKVQAQRDDTLPSLYPDVNAVFQVIFVVLDLSSSTPETRTPPIFSEARTRRTTANLSSGAV